MKNLQQLTGLGMAMALFSLCHQSPAAIDVSFVAGEGGGYSATWTGTQAIPDNTDSGLAFNLTFADTGLQISSVSVSFNISGGWNGDLHGYLSHGDGSVLLLNRVGNGTYGNPGFDIVLTDGGNADFANYQDHSPIYNGNDQLTGSWQAQGGATAFGDAFTQADPSGTWTLFFADKSPLDVSTIVSWSVDLTAITAVPEPATWAGIAFATIFGSVQLVRQLRKRN